LLRFKAQRFRSVVPGPAFLVLGRTFPSQVDHRFDIWRPTYFAGIESPLDFAAKESGDCCNGNYDNYNGAEEAD
jgi:hypothetical protein